MVKTPLNNQNLRPNQVIDYARKSVERAGDRRSASIIDQHACNMETAEEYDLPLLQENWISEDRNHGGDEWWKRGPELGEQWGAVEGQPFRPGLTKLMKGVVSGQIKVVLCWSTCRLFRDVSIAHAMIDILGKHHCALYDRNGPVAIDTPESRASVLQNAVAAQQYREMCAVNSPRGVRRLRQSGKVVVTGNVLGFRHIGKSRVRCVPEEIALVRRIFSLFCSGMTLAAISRLMKSEGIAFAPELYESRSIKRTKQTYDFVYTKQLRTVLMDCRYQGRQRNGGSEWSCPAFLVDGEPAVDPALYKMAHDILANRRPTSNHVSEDNYLAGLMKCGLCGQYLTINPVKQKDGSIKKYWISKKHDIQTWCKDSLPNITEVAMRSYLETTFLPLLHAELVDMMEVMGGSDAATEKALLEIQIAEKIQTFRDAIKEQFKAGKLTAMISEILEEEHKAEIGRMQERIRELEQAVRDQAETLAAHTTATSIVERWNSYSDSEKRLAIHHVLKWVVLLPSADYSDRPKRRGGSRSVERKMEGAPAAGKVVFLTAWNTMHTAIVKRVSVPGSRTWHKPLGLVPAPIEECVGSCADLPNPAGLASGLERSYQGRSFRYQPSEVMPGYLTPQKIADFEVD